MERYKCPACGQESDFRVETSYVMTLSGTGELSHENRGEPCFDMDAYCFCPQCEYEAVIEYFLVKETENA